MDLGSFFYYIQCYNETKKLGPVWDGHLAHQTALL